jgi:protein TonB
MRLFYSFLAVIFFSVSTPSYVTAQKLKTPRAPKSPNSMQIEAPKPMDPPAPPKYEDEIFKVVEEMPRFPGCEEMEGTNSEIKSCAQIKLVDYISSNLEYPVDARKAGIEGNVIIQYIVTSTGEIDELKLLRDIGGGCGEAGIAVFEKMQADGIIWIPGKQRGKAVNVQLTLPIKFAL